MSTVCYYVELCDVVEELLWTGYIWKTLSGEELGDVGAVPEKELQPVRVGGLHRLTDINEVDPPLMPQHVEGTEVRVHQMTCCEHPLHALQIQMRTWYTLYRNVHVHVE